jgi:hypothetical protein
MLIGRRIKVLLYPNGPLIAGCNDWRVSADDVSMSTYIVDSNARTYDFTSYPCSDKLSGLSLEKTLVV